MDSTFASIAEDEKLTPISKKNVLSIINDFAEGDWRYSKFLNFIWDNVKDTALTARERENLINQEQSMLVEAAKKLRLTDSEDDIGKGSELAEIVLYGIMRHHYGALPAVPKIFYKQNSRDNAKGADSVHIILNGTDFTIWFGEAKFYSDIKDARLGAIIQSVENSLTREKIELENSIITNVKDLDDLIEDIAIKERVLAAISAGVSTDTIKPILNIPILLLHECPITATSKTLSDEYKAEIMAFHKDRANAYFTKQIKKFGASLWMYSEITFHVILFPVPCKKTIVNRFVENVEFYKKQ